MQKSASVATLAVLAVLLLPTTYNNEKGKSANYLGKEKRRELSLFMAF